MRIRGTDQKIFGGIKRVRGRIFFKAELTKYFLNIKGEVFLSELCLSENFHSRMILMR